MRTVPVDIASKLNREVQTRANGSAPSSDIWIGRPTTTLLNDTFLEQQIITTGTITDSAVAVCHPRRGLDNTHIYVACIIDGVAKVVVSRAYTKMSSHIWVDTGFSEPAIGVSIAFDGTMPKQVTDQIEFITDTEPWIFWFTSDGHCYGQMLFDESTRITLSETNCTDITAVRATWSEVPGFDFGVCLFMLLNGVPYVRQLIDDVWYDAAVIPSSYLPSGVTFTQISASRTWDYRVALQLVDTTGVIYEVFTQLMGIGSKNAEHLEVTRVSADSELTEVFYSDASTAEHIEVADINAGALYGGLYSLGVPSLIGAINIDDGNGDYGKKAKFIFDTHLNPTLVAAQYSAFSIVDSINVSYIATSATVDSDGKTVILTFVDFNSAFGECTAKYVAGTVASMAGISLVDKSLGFTPTNLVPPAIPAPQVSEVTNI